MKHILSVDDFTADSLGEICDQADWIVARTKEGRLAQTSIPEHIGKTLITLFYEPSTRTRLSFEFAAQALGMHVSGSENARQFSSAAKGETLEDTLGVLNEYFPYVCGGGVVIRHDETGEIAANAHYSQFPILNGGDGKGEHPTQTMIDMFTMRHFAGRFDNLHVVMGGDLKYGRTVRSLSKQLAKHSGNRITYVSTEDLKMEDDVKDILAATGVAFSETDDMEKAVSDADFVYMTRSQLERQSDELKSKPVEPIIIGKAVLRAMPAHARLMHPMPITNEYTADVRRDLRAIHLKQAGFGVPVRIAAIDYALSS